MDLGSGTRDRGGLLRALLVTARPRQWSKNVLVFGAPITGGVLLQPTPFVRTVLAFVAFCLVASGIYYVNDIVDRDSDRAHPVKRRRPVAAGRLPLGLAGLMAVALLLGGLMIAILGVGPRLAGVVGIYILLSLAYTFVLRGIVLLDIAAVAGGFVLRAVAGGWRLYTNPAAGAAVEAFLHAGQRSRLTRAALETLAVIAYRQPVTRFQVAAVRGVNVDGVFRTLLARGLIQQVGSDDGPGQAALYGTAPAFLEQLGLNSLDQLPPIKDYLPEGVDLIELQEQP